MIAKAHATLSPRQWPMQQVMQRVVDAVGWDGTIAGEAVDLHSEESKLDFDTLEFIHSRKTGALFVGAAAIGAMLANMSPAALGRIEVFAKNLGLAFQITDDILDAVGTPEQLGKDVGKDELRLTFVKLAGGAARARGPVGPSTHVASEKTPVRTSATRKERRSDVGITVIASRGR